MTYFVAVKSLMFFCTAPRSPTAYRLRSSTSKHAIQTTTTTSNLRSTTSSETDTDSGSGNSKN